jgi:GGDEF domain-containing protein
VGIALYPQDATTRDSLLKTADAAMYVAKNDRSARVGTQVNLQEHELVPEGSR